MTNEWRAELMAGESDLSARGRSCDDQRKRRKFRGTSGARTRAVWGTSQWTLANELNVTRLTPFEALWTAKKTSQMRVLSSAGISCLYFTILFRLRLTIHVRFRLGCALTRPLGWPYQRIRDPKRQLWIRLNCSTDVPKSSTHRNVQKKRMLQQSGWLIPSTVCATDHRNYSQSPGSAVVG